MKSKFMEGLAVEEKIGVIAFTSIILTTLKFQLAILGTILIVGIFCIIKGIRGKK